MRDEDQQKLIELQLIDEQIKQIQQQLQLFEQQLHELVNLRETLQSLKDVPSKTKAILPLGAGVFLRAELQQPETVLMNIGAKTIAPRPLPEAITVVEKQLHELANLRETFHGELQKAAIRGTNLQEELKESLGTEKQP